MTHQTLEIKYIPLQKLRNPDEKVIHSKLTHSKFFQWLDQNCHKCRKWSLCDRIKVDEMTCPVNPCPDKTKRVTGKARRKKPIVDVASAKRLLNAGHNISNVARILRVTRYRLVKVLK